MQDQAGLNPTPHKSSALLKRPSTASLQWLWVLVSFCLSAAGHAIAIALMLGAWAGLQVSVWSGFVKTLGLGFAGNPVGLASALHIASAALAAWTALLVTPQAGRRQWRVLFGFTWILNIAVPMLGLGIQISSIIGYRFRPQFKLPPLLAVTEPSYSEQRAAAQHRRKVGARVNVLDTQLAAADRINAQLALQDAPGKISATLLRSLLTDPVEDIRLLAYGLLDGKEKKISQRILLEQDVLKQAADPQQIYAAQRRLAELNWELIYQRMVQGDMKKFCGQQANQFARDALSLRPDDGGLWFLMARVNLALNEPDQAQIHLAQAERLGIPQVQLLPYYAEMAFEKHDYRSLQANLAKLPGRPSSQALGAVYEFWN